MTRRRLDSPRLVVASHNAGKVAEIRELLAPWGVETVSAAQLGLPVPEETEETFEGNAAIKARAAAQASGLPALADDSGLAIDALDGEPGVHTADWAETPQGRDFDLAMKTAHDALVARGAAPPWTARFVCVLCLGWPDGHVEIVRGEAEGQFVWPPRGDQGHGYDPIFVPEGREETYAELPPHTKNAISHRADAFEKLVDEVIPPRLAFQPAGVGRPAPPGFAFTRRWWLPLVLFCLGLIALFLVHGLFWVGVVGAAGLLWITAAKFTQPPWRF
ncbi:MAG: RdgB/HAM1 family non-canonical purine NTP pyrophosphatase [Pseudomonadota bacterium]